MRPVVKSVSDCVGNGLGVVARVSVGSVSVGFRGEWAQNNDACFPERAVVEARKVS